MKTIYKVLISFGIGICLIIAGLSIGGLGELSEVGLFGHLNFKWKSHEIDDRDFTASHDIDNLEVNVHNGTVQFHTDSHIENIRITANCLYSGFDIYQKSDKIVIDQPHYWWFTQKYERAQIDIYIPEHTSLKTVKLNMSAGVLNVNDLKAETVKIDAAAGRVKASRLECQELKVDTAMGQTSLQEVTVHKKANIDVGAGSASIHLTGHEDDYDTSVSVGLGHVKVGNMSYSGIADRDSHRNDGQIKLDIDCGLGNVKVEMEDLL